MVITACKPRAQSNVVSKTEGYPKQNIGLSEQLLALIFLSVGIFSNEAWMQSTGWLWGFPWRRKRGYSRTRSVSAKS